MEVLMKLENHQDSIYPVKAKKVISNLDHATSMEDRNPYNEVLDELYNVMDVLHIERVDRPVQSAFLIIFPPPMHRLMYFQFLKQVDCNEYLQ